MKIQKANNFNLKKQKCIIIEIHFLEVLNVNHIKYKFVTISNLQKYYDNK